MKEINQEINIELQKRKVKTVTLLTFVIFFIGEISALSFYKLNSESPSLLSGFAVQQSLSYPNIHKSYLIFSSVVIALLTIINFLFLNHLKKIYASLENSNNEILLEVNSLNKEKEDEIKELAFTRNEILMKLMAKQK